MTELWLRRSENSRLSFEEFWYLLVKAKEEKLQNFAKTIRKVRKKCGEYFFFRNSPKDNFIYRGILKKFEYCL